MAPNIVSDLLTLSKEFPENSVANNTAADIVVPPKLPTTTTARATTKPTEDTLKSKEGLLKFKTTLIWPNVISIVLLHVISAYMFLTLPFWVSKGSFLWALLLGQAGGFGVTGGVHRLWCHRSYKAKWPLRVILIICYSIAGQNTVYDWVRDHRVHHKYTETDADPHNSNRGFFFAHVGWLMMKKHPDVIRRGQQIDMSDVLADPIVSFNHKFFVPMKLLFCFIIPIVVPVYVWNETWYTTIMAQVFVRYVMGLNFTWFVNSAAHMWGNRPYNKKISPSENLAVAIVAMGEGWHNYHHVFPWDYKAAELGDYAFNTTTFLIDMFAKIGWAYDLKEPSMNLVKKYAERHGDGSHHRHGHHHHHDEWQEVAAPECDQ